MKVKRIVANIETKRTLRPKRQTALCRLFLCFSVLLPAARSAEAADNNCFMPGGAVALSGLALLGIGSGMLSDSENSGEGSGRLLLAASGLGALGAGSFMYISCRREPLTGKETSPEIRQKRVGQIGLRTWNINKGIGATLALNLSKDFVAETTYSTDWYEKVEETDELITEKHSARYAALHVQWYFFDPLYIGVGAAYRKWQGSFDYFKYNETTGDHVSSETAASGSSYGADIALGARHSVNDVFIGVECGGVFFPQGGHRSNDDVSTARPVIVERRRSYIDSETRPVARYLGVNVGISF